MAKRVGHTSDLEVARWEIEQKFKNPSNLQSTPEFNTKQEAEEWEKKAATEMNCKVFKLESKKKSQRVRWFGFAFEQDGPNKPEPVSLQLANNLSNIPAK